MLRATEYVPASIYIRYLDMACAHARTARVTDLSAMVKTQVTLGAPWALVFQSSL